MENKETTYEYEMFFDSKEDEPVQIHGWIPIATDRIRKPEKIEDYIKSGLLRKLEKPIVEEKQTAEEVENSAIRLNRIAKEINNPISNWGVGFTAEIMNEYAKEYATQKLASTESVYKEVIDDLKREIQEQAKEIERLRGQLQGGTCDTCGKDNSKLGFCPKCDTDAIN